MRKVPRQSMLKPSDKVHRGLAQWKAMSRISSGHCLLNPGSKIHAARKAIVDEDFDYKGQS